MFAPDGCERSFSCVTSISKTVARQLLPASGERRYAIMASTLMSLTPSLFAICRRDSFSFPGKELPLGSTKEQVPDFV
jgi:hypothetical protein